MNYLFAALGDSIGFGGVPSRRVKEASGVALSTRRSGPSILPELSEPIPAGPVPSHWQPFQPVARPDGVWSPVADLEETDGSFIIEMELPGVTKDDVIIDFHQSELMVVGELKGGRAAGWCAGRPGVSGSSSSG